MRCEELYLKDMEALECEAVIMACTARADGTFDVETDRTSLFPEGGGQLSDTGRMNGARILHCRETNNTVLHQTDKPFTPGEAVHIAADRRARLVHTQQHTGEHLLSFAYAHLFGAENIGFHMSEELVTIDLDRELTDAEIREGEAFANEMVWANRPIRIFTVDTGELENLPLRKKNEKLRGEVRIVEIEGGEMCTCCGTHFAHTAPVGIIKVLEHARYKQGCRIAFVCGALALRWFALENRELRHTAAQLSVRPEGVWNAVQRKEEQLAALHAELRQKNVQLAELYGERFMKNAANCEGYRLVTEVLPFDFETGKTIAEALCKAKDLFVLLFCAEGARYRYICAAGGACPVDCRDTAQKINGMLGAKGGGNQKLAQGSFPKVPDSERRMAELIDRYRRGEMPAQPE